MINSKFSPAGFNDTLADQHQQDSTRRFTLEFGLFVVILFGSFMVMVNDLDFNSLFLDEAINVMIGRDILHGDFSRNALSFHFGSYLYPILSAAADSLGGITGMRLASTILVCVTSAFIYFTGRILFGRKAGLLGMMLFAFNGNILNLGQMAVYDVLALPLLSAAWYCLVSAATSTSNQRRLLLTASVLAVLGTLSKYIGLVYLPALILTTLALYWLQGNRVQSVEIRLWVYFVLPIVLSLGVYAAFTWHDLIQVFQGQGFSPAPRGLVFKIIAQEIGWIIIFSIGGLALLGYSIARGRHENTQSFFGGEGSHVRWQTLPITYRRPFFIITLLLFSFWLAAPLQQWLTANNRSLWKNCAYSLIFLAPLAGYFVSAGIIFLRSRRNMALRLAGMLVLCAGVYAFVDGVLDSNWSFHQSWPDTRGVINYLQEQGLNENSRVLAEEMDVYEYYFSPEINDSRVWNNFWNMNYAGLSGQEGALAAIRARALDYVIIDDYYLPGIRERATPILQEAGYVIGWQETQKLRTGDTIWVQVFIRGDIDRP